MSEKRLTPKVTWKSSGDHSRQKNDDALDRAVPVDRGGRYLAPTRARKKFEEVRKLLTYETIFGRPIVREWRRGNFVRLYWPDGSWLYVDSAGSVRSNGGQATRAKFKHGLR
jgi:hypothetical protein